MLIFIRFNTWISPIFGLYIYEKLTNTYFSSQKNNTWVVPEKNPENAINFEFLPVSLFEKTSIISKGNNLVLDLAQIKAKNKIGFWKKHGKANQQFKIVDIFTNSTVLPKEINDYAEYRLIVNGKCAYVKEMAPNSYEVYVRVCDPNLPGGVFKITLDKYINEHMMINDADSLKHITHTYINNPVTNIPRVVAEVETVPLYNSYNTNKYHNIITKKIIREPIVSESYMPIIHQTKNIIREYPEDMMVQHALRHNNLHFNETRNALERHLIEDGNYVVH